MKHLNVEIKARCANPEKVREFLKQHDAEFRGTDHQSDTYFNTTNGRLKLREGKIENNLIYYERENDAGPKSSHFHLINIPDAKSLKEAFQKAIGIKVIVEKKREIWFIANVKFHIDEVPGLGNFVEIEASDLYADKTKEELETQCDHYLEELQIKEEDMISLSYSDMLMEQLSE